MLLSTLPRLFCYQLNQVRVLCGGGILLNEILNTQGIPTIFRSSNKLHFYSDCFSVLVPTEFLQKKTINIHFLRLICLKYFLTHHKQYAPISVAHHSFSLGKYNGRRSMYQFRNTMQYQLFMISNFCSYFTFM